MRAALYGGVAPTRAYIPDYETYLDHVAAAYQAMDERRAIKSLLRVAA